MLYFDICFALGELGLKIIKWRNLEDFQNYLEVKYVWKCWWADYFRIWCGDDIDIVSWISDGSDVYKLFVTSWIWRNALSFLVFEGVRVGVRGPYCQKRG